jgi:hypothetical protein
MEIRRLAGPIRDVESADRHGSVSAGLRMYRFGEPWSRSIDYLGAAAIACTAKMIGQIALNTIMPKASGSAT